MNWHRLAETYLLVMSCALHGTASQLAAGNGDLAGQSKRDLSLSYAATDIDSKVGTRVKTITVIKNIGSSDKLAINPALHKSEEWGSAFRDNFESYASIPDVPDVEDLFEFVKKQDSKKSDDRKSTTPATTKKTPTEAPKPVTEEASEAAPPAEAPAKESSDSVDKIKGDAELIVGVAKSTANNNITDLLRSQSLRRNRARETVINFNYTAPQQSVQQYFEKYVQETTDNGYEYPQPQQQKQQPQKPCAPNTITVTTPSGRTYDITLDNSKSNGNPYIAPAVSKRPQIVQQQQPVTKAPPPSPTTPTSYISVNSILPPLLTGGVQTFNSPPNYNVNISPSNNNLNNPRTGQPQPKNVYTTSQKPYVAPNVLNGIAAAKPAAPIKPVFFNAPKLLRTNIFGAAANRPNTARSRGLKY